jgi:TolA-binding protein
MKIARGVVGLIGLAALFWINGSAWAQQRPPEVRRALPAEEPSATPERPSPPTDADVEGTAPSRPTSEESSTSEPESPPRRQLNYANALFTRKLYDLALPEYQKYLEDYPGGSGRANAYFSLGECNRNLGKPGAARTNFQRVLDDYGESDFAGSAAYALAEMAFTTKNYAAALPLFHRSAAKSKEAAVALSARYFEARCLEILDRKSEACDIYLQVAEVKNPNPYREDARLTGATLALARGRKTDAFRQYEALSNETQKPALKAETAVRAGLLAVDLQQPEKGKIDKAMGDKALALLQKARTLPKAGRWAGVAQVGLLRLQFQSGQYAQLLADYQKVQGEIPEEARAEVMLFVANSHRQLGHTEEAEEIYREIVAKYPNREEAKDARYQRLINVYNADPDALLAEVDEFLGSSPPAERADQAKLLKAEAFYKQQKFAEAAPIYAELRTSQLSPKLRAETSYKLGWCYVQTKDVAGIVEAFGYFAQAFPDSPQAPSALAQRALVFQQDKNYNAALSDLNTILARYPAAKEREAALQQKALILGQQENPKGMTDAFKQLLKEFPKSTVAAQAQYYIGKAAFEAKDYKNALTALSAARQLSKEQYYNLATVRIISCHFYLKNRAALTKEVDDFMAASSTASAPAEILEWLGIEYYNEKNYPAAEKYLSALGKIDNRNGGKPDFWFYLGDAATRLQKFDEAEDAFSNYLQTATDPAGKAKVLLALGAVKIASHKADDAQKIAQEIMILQPEGRVNAEARLLAGDVQLERGHFEEAGKAFMGVALLYDDPAITPRALQKAAVAYQRAGRTTEAEHASRQLREKYPSYKEG